MQNQSYFFYTLFLLLFFFFLCFPRRTKLRERVNYSNELKVTIDFFFFFFHSASISCFQVSSFSRKLEAKFLSTCNVLTWLREFFQPYNRLIKVRDRLCSLSYFATSIAGNVHFRVIQYL